MWILTYFLIGFVVAVFFAYKNYKLFKYIHWAKNFGDFCINIAIWPITLIKDIFSGNWSK